MSERARQSSRRRICKPERSRVESSREEPGKKELKVSKGEEYRGVQIQIQQFSEKYFVEQSAVDK